MRWKQRGDVGLVLLEITRGGERRLMIEVGIRGKSRSGNTDDEEE